MPDKARYTRVEDTGTFSIAVIASSRWRDVSSALQPSFQLTEQQALDQVLPVAGGSQFDKSRQTSVGLSVGLVDAGPTTSVERKQTLKLDPITLKPIAGDAGNAASETTTTTTADGMPVEVEPVTVPPASLEGAAVAAPEAGFGAQPQLRFDQATALLQHVRLLNRRIADMVNTRGYTPYVVTLKLINQPVRQDLPLNIYYDIGFFCVAGGAAATAPSETAPEIRDASITDAAKTTDVDGAAALSGKGGSSRSSFCSASSTARRSSSSAGAATAARASSNSTRARPPPCLWACLRRALSMRMRRMASAAAPKKWARPCHPASPAPAGPTSRRYASCTSAVG